MNMAKLIYRNHFLQGFFFAATVLDFGLTRNIYICIYIYRERERERVRERVITVKKTIYNVYIERECSTRNKLYL